jgi:hypothetical protein
MIFTNNLDVLIDVSSSWFKLGKVQQSQNWQCLKRFSLIASLYDSYLCGPCCTTVSKGFEVVKTHLSMIQI